MKNPNQENILRKIYEIIGQTPDVKVYGTRYAKENEFIMDQALREIQELIKQELGGAI